MSERKDSKMKANISSHPTAGCGILSLSSIVFSGSELLSPTQVQEEDLCRCMSIEKEYPHTHPPGPTMLEAASHRIITQSIASHTAKESECFVTLSPKTKPPSWRKFIKICDV